MEHELIDDGIDIILKVRKGLIAKSDISSAFHILQIAVDSYHLLGFQWLDKYSLIDVYLWDVPLVVRILKSSLPYSRDCS